MARISGGAGHLPLPEASDTVCTEKSPRERDSAVSIDHFVGEGTVTVPTIVVDITAGPQLGNGWIAYVDPVPHPRQQRGQRIYQAADAGRRSDCTRWRVSIIPRPIGEAMYPT